MMRSGSCSIVVLLLLNALVMGENWPGWRGPRGDGSSTDQSLPQMWDGPTGKNIQWKKSLPGEGHSSPVIWDNRVFVTVCVPETQDRALLCLDRETGNTIWKRSVLTARLESKHALNSYASSTPVTDGELVFVTFLEVGTEQVVAPNVSSVRMIYPGTMVVAAYDFSGRRVWLERPGPFVSAHGFSNNPVLYNNSVIINGDHDGDSYIVALDKQTGKEIWKTERRHKTRSYGTPLIRRIGKRDQLVLAGSQCVASFDPASGVRTWNVEGPTEQFVASVVYGDNQFFAVGGYPTHHVMAISPTGSGDVTDSHVQWHKTNVRCYVPSPVVVGDFLVVADDRGTASCFDTSTGKRLWQTRMGKHYSASLLNVAGLVYFVADDGVTKILKPAATPMVLATNELGENVYSSPAVSDGQLLIRSDRHLFSIAETGR